MRTSPRISVLGESGNLCIAGNGLSEDHKTVKKFWRWLPFSLTVDDVPDLDYGGRASPGHLPTAAGDGFLWKPTYI